MRFNPPPNWPVPPGWAPSPGWDVDPAWPPAPPGWQFWLPDDQSLERGVGPMLAGTPRPGVPRWLTAVLLVVLIAGYGLAALLTQGWWNRDRPTTAAHASFQVRPLAGSSVTPEELAGARKVLQSRIRRLGGHDGAVSIDADSAQLSASGVSGDQLRSVAAVGALHIRPVIHVIAAHPDRASAPGRPAPISDKRIRDEKELRQSSNPQIQLLALQFQSTRCGDPDALAANDDPELPLVTCSRDGTQAYLLDRSIVAGDQITRATSGLDRDRGQYVVDVQFDDRATAAWADFTGSKSGTQVAVTVDSEVFSAPVVRDEITDGRAQISGQFDADSARSFASVLAGGRLSLVLTEQSVQTVALHPGFWTIPRIVVVAGAVLVGLVMIVSLVMLGRRRT